MGDIRSKSNNIEIDVTTLGTDITYEFSSSGENTATTKYFDLDGPAIFINIRPSAIVQITTINDVTLTDPITVQTTGFSIKKSLNPGMEIDSMIVRTTSASTNIKVFAY